MGSDREIAIEAEREKAVEELSAVKAAFAGLVLIAPSKRAVCRQP